MSIDDNVLISHYCSLRTAGYVFSNIAASVLLFELIWLLSSQLCLLRDGFRCWVLHTSKAHQQLKCRWAWAGPITWHFQSHTFLLNSNVLLVHFYETLAACGPLEHAIALLKSAVTFFTLCTVENRLLDWNSQLVDYLCRS
jgi:hypothetical protein